jgi:hypothetical protein
MLDFNKSPAIRESRQPDFSHALQADRAETSRLEPCVAQGAGGEEFQPLSPCWPYDCDLRGRPNARISSNERTTTSSRGGGHGLDAEDVKGTAQIVGERRQAELGAHVGEAAHQERALMHPLLDAAERMLNDLAPTVENLLRGRARSHGRAPAGGARLTNHSGRS